MKIIESMKGTIAECKEEVKRTISDSRGGEQMPQSEFESEIDKSEYEKNRLTKDTIKRKIADVESINITVEPLKIYTVLDHLIDISHSDIDSAGNSYCRSYARAIISKYEQQLEVLRRHHPDNEKLEYYETQLKEMKVKAMVKRHLILVVALFIAGISAVYLLLSEIFR